MMGSPLSRHLCLLFALGTSFSIILAGPNDHYARIIELSREINDHQETIRPDEIFSKLSEIKSVRTLLGNPVRQNVAHREEIMIVLSLYKLAIELGQERCLQGRGFFKDSYYTNNYHVNNFIEIARILHDHYESDNMHQFIDHHYKLQLTMCQHNLLANFETKYSQMMKDNESKKMVVFAEKLVSSFAKSPVKLSQISFQERIDNFTQFLWNYYGRDYLIVRSGAKRIRSMMETIVNTECLKFFLSPLMTLVMTYDSTEPPRNSARVHKKFGNVIRAYDICLYLRTQLDPRESHNIEHKINSLMGSSKPRQSPAIDAVEPAEPIEPSLSTKRAQHNLDTARAERRKRIRDNQQPNVLITQTVVDDEDESNQQIQALQPIQTTITQTQPLSPTIQLDLHLQTGDQQQLPRPQKPVVVPKKGLTFDLND